MLEPSKAFIFTELVEGGFFKVFIVSHTELTETSALPPLLDQPHPRIEKFPTLVQVTKVGRAQTKIPMHLVFEIFQVRESSSYNQATKWMANKGYSPQVLPRTILFDELNDFLSHSESHVKDVSLSTLLIACAAEEHCSWESSVQNVL